MSSRFSVLMSVYRKDNPEYLNQALSSITRQTQNPSEIVIVKDGPLTEELEKVIASYCNAYNGMFRIIALPKNKGLGPALSEGLNACSFDIVARMDSDDISKPFRFEEQLKILDENPDLDVVGSWIDEFHRNTDNIVSIRKVPETTSEIIKYAKKRNPVNHPTVMFRRKAVLDAGGYGSYYLMEDYILWASMLKNGSKIYNIQDSLLFYRADDNMFRRRGGIKYIKSDIMLQKKLLELNFIDKKRYIINIIIRSIVRIIPNGLRVFVYRLLLRTKY